MKLLTMVWIGFSVIAQDGYLYDFNFNGNIYRVDTGTSTRTLISSVSYGTVYSAARNPLTGVVYYVEEGGGAVSIFDPSLSVINGGAENCVANPGNCNFEIHNGVGNPVLNYRLGFHPDGRLFAYSSSGGTARNIYLIDTSTGVATLFGSLAPGPVPTAGGDLAFNRADIACGVGDPFAMIAAGSMFIGVNDILYMVPASQINSCTPPCTLTPVPINTNLPGSQTVTGLGFEYDGDLWLGEYANFFTGQMIRVNPCNAATALSTIGGLGLTVELTGNIGLATTPVFLSEVHINGQQISWKSLGSAGVIGYNLYEIRGEKWSKLNDGLIQVDWNKQNSWQLFTFKVDHEVDTASVAIEAQDVYGNREVHGPFIEGKDIRSLNVNQIDWSSIGSELQQFENVRDTPGNFSKTAVKIMVEHEGWYRVTWEDLPSSVNPSDGIPIKRLSLTRDTELVPIFVRSNDDFFGPGDSLEFLGHSRESIYGLAETYLLNLGQRGVFVKTGGQNSSTDGVTQAVVRESYQDNLHYSFSSPFADPWYLESLLAFDSQLVRPFGLELKGIVPGTPIKLDLKTYGVTNYPDEPDHHLRILFNGHLLDDEVWDGLAAYTPSLSIPPNFVSESNEVVFEMPADLGVPADLIHVESIQVTYVGTLDSTVSKFEVQPGKTYRIETQGESIVAYVELGKDTFRYEFESTPNRYFQVSIPKSGSEKGTVYLNRGNVFELPVLKRKTAPLELDGKVDLLLVSHPLFVSSLERFVTFKKSQGWSVQTITTEQVYDQFSKGRPDALAIQALVTSAAKNNGTRYVVLVGGDTYDYDDNLGLGSISFVPTLYTRTHPVVHFTPSDTLLGDIDGDRVPDVAVGRFPVRTINELDNLITKSIQYATVDLDPAAILLTDRFVPNANFRELGTSLGSLFPEEWRIERADMDVLGVTDARDHLVQTINRGVRITEYIGHSSFNSWSFEGLFRSSDVGSFLHNAGVPTGVVQWGCWNTYHVHPEYETLAHRFLLEDNKGAAFVIGSSTLTEFDGDRKLAESLASYMGKPGMTIGAALNLAKAKLASTGSYEDVILGISLLGDPTIQVGGANDSR